MHPRPRLPESHHRGSRTGGACTRKEEACERLAEARELLAQEIGPSLTSFALRFALALPIFICEGKRSGPIVPAVITGMNNRGQVEGILAAAEQPIPSAEVVEKALQLWRSHGAL